MIEGLTPYECWQLCTYGDYIPEDKDALQHDEFDSINSSTEMNPNF
jgi:hypothetical protein